MRLYTPPPFSAFKLLFPVIILFLFSFSAQAQSIRPGNSDSASGRVTDANGAVLPGATITLRNLATGLERVTTTEADGSFGFPGLRDGRYKISASAPGFSLVEMLIESLSGDPLDFRLEPSALVDAVTVVSGSRQEELRESLNTRVDVIGRARIRDTGDESVGEVLRELPGVVTRRGTQGTGAAGEQIQGIDSRQVLVLFDGQPIIGARGIKRGVLNLDRQSINPLERIEVVKGASSALYGSDAIGGVINQISRDALAPVETSLTLSGGSLSRLDVRGDAGFARDRFSLLVSGERHKQNPFDLTPTTFDTTGVGFHREDAFAKMSYNLTPDLSVRAWARSYWGRERGRALGEEGNLDSTIDEDSQSFNLAADWQINKRAAAQIRGYSARWDEITNSVLSPTNTPIAPGNLFERYGKVDGSFSYLLGERQYIQTGGEWATTRYRGFNRLANDSGHSAEIASIWAQDRLSFANRVTITAGLRFDNHSIFGSAVSPKAGLNFRLTEYWRIRASYGRGFRAPDLGQLFYRFLNPTNFYQVIGNPNLNPEYADSIQIGSEFTARNRRARFAINLFRNDVDNLIESQSLGFITSPQQLRDIAAREGIDLTLFRPTLGRLLFFYKNIAQARTQGIELDGDLSLPRGFSFGGAYTYLYARDRAASVPLLNRHKHHGNLRLAWESNARTGLRANLRGTFYSKWINALATATSPDVIPPGFALWDVYLAKRIYRGFELFGAVDNFTDNKDPNMGLLDATTGAPLPIYRTEYGRTFRVGMRFTWAQERR
jgi:outer membrane receptor for ferrienterochelin and colicins